MLPDTFTSTHDDNDIYQALETLLDNEGFTAPLRESLIQVAEIKNAPELIAFLSRKEVLELLGPHSVLEQNYDLYSTLNKFFFIALSSRKKENIDRVLNLNPLLTRTYQIEFFQWHLSTFTPLQPDIEIENDFNPNDMSWLLTNRDEPDDALLSSLYEELLNPQEILNDRTELEATESMLTLPVRVKSSWQEKLIARILRSNSMIAKQRILSAYQRGDTLTNPIATYLHHAKTDFKKQISAVYHIANSNFGPACTALFNTVSPNQPSLFEEWINAEEGCHRNHFIRTVLSSRNAKAIQNLLDNNYLEAYIGATTIGTSEWKGAIRIILSSRNTKAIQYLVNNKFIEAYIDAMEIGSTEWKEAIYSVLVSRNRKAVQNLMNNKLIETFFAAVEEGSSEWNNAIRAILFTRHSATIEILVLNKYLETFITATETGSLEWMEKIRAVLTSQNPKAIQILLDKKMIEAFIGANAVGSPEWREAIRATLGSHSPSAIKTLVSNKYLETFIDASEIGSLEWIEGIRAVLTSQNTKAIQILVDKKLIEAFIRASAVDSSEWKKAICSVLATQHRKAIENLVDNNLIEAFLAATIEGSPEWIGAIRVILASRSPAAIQTLVINKYKHLETFIGAMETSSLEWMEAIRAIIASKSPKAIQYLVDNKHLQAFIDGMPTGSPEWIATIRAFLANHTPAMIQFLVDNEYLGAFISKMPANSPEWNEAIHFILATANSKTIQYLVNNKQLEAFINGKEKGSSEWKKAIEAILNTRCQNAIKLVVIQDFIATTAANSLERNEAILTVLSTQYAEAILILQNNNYLTNFITSMTAGSPEWTKAIKIILATQNSKNIETLIVNKGHLKAFIDATEAGSIERYEAIRAILASQCAKAIKTIINYLGAFIAATESSSERNKAIRAILSSRNPDAIKTLVADNNKHLATFIATTEEETLDRYEAIHAIIVSRNNKAINFIYEKTYFHWWLTQPSLGWKEKIHQAISAQSSLIIQSVAGTKAIWPANDKISENFEASYFAYLLLIAPEKTETILKQKYIKPAYKETVLKELKEICNKYEYSFSLNYPAAVSYLEAEEPSTHLAKRVRETETTPSTKKRKVDKTKDCLDLLSKFKDEGTTNFSLDALIRTYTFSTSAEKETKLLIKEINKIIKKELGLKNIQIVKIPKQLQYKLVVKVATEYDRLIEHFTTLLTNTQNIAVPEITAQSVTSTQVEERVIPSTNASEAVVSLNNNLITPPQNQDVIMSEASTILPTLPSSSINHKGLSQSSHPLGIIATRGFFGPTNVYYSLRPQSNQSAQASNKPQS